MNGKFITFEGIEGCGKTTQIKLLNEYLKKRGIKTVLTREPGGTLIGDEIRKTLLDANNKKMHPVTELLLYSASRRQHLEELIKPAIAEGKFVLCDRYSDSTTAYQGAARKIGGKILTDLDKIATDALKPDLTIIFDIDPKEGLKRVAGRGTLDRLEQEEFNFHERVRNGYLEIAKAEPKRVKVLDASKKIEDLHKEIIGIITHLCS